VSAAERGPATSDGRKLALAAIAFGWFLTLGMRFLLPAILPQIKATFSIDNATAGLAISAIWAGYAVMQFPAGALVDRVDARPLLSASLALAGASLGLISASPVFSVFLLSCGLFGLGTGLFGPPRGIALSNIFAPNPGTAFGITLAAGSVGSATLPFLASLLLSSIGWRLTVGLALAPFLVTATVTYRAVPGRSTDGDPKSSLSAAGTLAALKTALADRTVIVSVTGLTLVIFVFQALTAFFPSYLIQEKGLAQETAGALFALLFVAGAAFQLVGGSATDRFGSRTVMLATTAVTVVATGALPLTDGLVPLGMLTAVLASQMALQPVANEYVIDVLADEARGTAWGLLRTTFFLVGSTGSTVVGVLSDRGLFGEAFYLLAALIAVAGGIFLLLPVERTRPG
jgi:predicted MFS family arabinose efflux permease